MPEPVNESVPVPVTVLLIVRFPDALYWSVPLLVTLPEETVPPLSSRSVAPEEIIPAVHSVP